MKEKRKERLLKKKQFFSWKIFNSQTEDPVESYYLFKCVNELVAVIYAKLGEKSLLYVSAERCSSR